MIRIVGMGLCCLALGALLFGLLFGPEAKWPSERGVVPAPLSPRAEGPAAEIVDAPAAELVEAPAAPPAPGPQVDILRVERDGSALVSGRATPGAEVEIIVDEVAAGMAPADDQGSFVVFLSLPDAPVPQSVALRERNAAGQIVRSAQSFIVETRRPDMPQPAPPGEASGRDALVADPLASDAVSTRETRILPAASGPQGLDSEAGERRSATPGPAAILSDTGQFPAAQIVPVEPPEPTPGPTAPDAGVREAAVLVEAPVATAEESGSPADPAHGGVEPASAARGGTDGVNAAAVVVEPSGVDRAGEAVVSRRASLSSPEPAGGELSGGRDPDDRAATVLPDGAGDVAPDGPARDRPSASAFAAAGPSALAGTTGEGGHQETGPVSDGADAIRSPEAPQGLAAPRVLRVEGGEVSVMQDDIGRPALSIDTIRYTPEGTVVLGGRAPKSTPLRVYIDNRPLDAVRSGPDGQWRLDLPALEERVYALRVDQLDAQGDVAARAETPFQPESKGDLDALSGSVEDGLRQVTVQPGFTLWAIAERNYGDGLSFVRVFEANSAKISDPDLIYPGQIFAVPD